jgi:very-short-patch-repair endonuclease
MGGKSAKDLVIAALAGDQYGVVSRAQLLQAGLTSREIERRTEARRLIALHRGVYAVGHRVLKVEGRWMAAVLAAGEGAVLSHRDAAALWDLCPTPHGAIHVTVPGDPGRRRRPGLQIHRSVTLAHADTVVHRGIPVTTATRTIVDLARTTQGRRLEELIDRADFHGLVDFATLGQANAAALRAVLENYRPAPTQSELEEAFLRLCDDHDLPRPETGVRVEGYTVDFVWCDLKLAVEVDGYRYHRAPHKFETDRERDVVLTAAGWTVLRFTWRQLTERPAWVAAKVRACVRARSPASRTPAGRSRRRTGTAA